MINYYFINSNQQVQPTKRGEEFEDKETCRIITFDMVPIAQQRPRTRVIQPKGDRKPYAQIYTVNSKHKKKLLKQIIRRPIFEVATFAYALALYTPPKSYNSYHPEKSWGERKVTKPDSTNILKFYEDLLEGLFMPKDQFVNPPMCERFYSDKNQLIFAVIPTDEVKMNIPRIIRDHFITQYHGE